MIEGAELYSTIPERAIGGTVALITEPHRIEFFNLNKSSEEERESLLIPDPFAKNLERNIQAQMGSLSLRDKTHTHISQEEILKLLEPKIFEGSQKKIA